MTEPTAEACLAMIERLKVVRNLPCADDDLGIIDAISDAEDLFRSIAPRLAVPEDGVEAAVDNACDAASGAAGGPWGERELKIAETAARAALAAYEPIVQARIREAVGGERERCRAALRNEWHAVQKEFQLRPGSPAEVLAARALNSIAIRQQPEEDGRC